MTEEQKEKYINFLDKISEILGLNKPIDILRLCDVTDEYFQLIEKRITELEQENAKLTVQIEKMKCCENCQTVCDANGNCYLYKVGKCNPKDKTKWEMKKMTDEELEKRAERYARNSLSTLADTVIQDNVKLAYIKGAKEGNQLKDKGELTDKVKELKDKCSDLLDKLYLSGLSAKQIALVEKMQDVLGV